MRATVATSAVLPGSTQERTGMPSRATASAMTTADGVAALLAVAALAQRRVQLAAPGLGALVGLVDLEIGRRARPTLSPWTTSTSIPGRNP